MMTHTDTLTMHRWGISRDGLREAIVALIFISSFYVRLEPALTDFFALFAIVLYCRDGLHFSKYLAASFLILTIYLLGGLISCIPINAFAADADGYRPIQYPVVLAYTALSAVFIASYVTRDPSRYYKIERAYWIGGTLGALLGLAIFYRIEPISSLLRNIGYGYEGAYDFRVTGGYKDPNVFSTWLVLPIVTMMQALMIGRLRPSLTSLGSLAAMAAAIFLAYSRGAWIDIVAASVLMAGLTTILSPSVKQRQKLALIGIVGFILIVALLVALLSVPSIYSMFLDRLTFSKEYDVGETGRFGNQLNSIPMLMQLPLGFGPYRFGAIFHEAPHNTFLNAFAAGGWLSGIAFIVLTITNILLGLKTVFTRSPVQAVAIPVFSCLTVMTFQGIQIDDEHWRHLYWMMGISWGLYAAMLERNVSQARAQEFLTGWGLPTRAA